MVGNGHGWDTLGTSQTPRRGHFKALVPMIPEPSSDSRTRSTLEVVCRFNDAFNRHDVDAVMALMTDNCVFESTRPPPDGERIEGCQGVAAFWESFFARSPQAQFETEETARSRKNFPMSRADRMPDHGPRRAPG